MRVYPRGSEERTSALRGYEKGVPISSDLEPRSGAGAPVFMVGALRDPVGSNLDRVQIIKGWLDAEGKTQERVYDVARSAGHELDANGVLRPVGNTVDIENANWTNTTGASELATLWTDPEGVLLCPSAGDPDTPLRRQRHA